MLILIDRNIASSTEFDFKRKLTHWQGSRYLRVPVAYVKHQTHFNNKVEYVSYI